LSISDIDDAATRFKAVADLTGISPDNEIDQAEQSCLPLFRQLALESKNKHYRQIMKAIIASVEQGPQGMKAAHVTATRVVELAFIWTLEYFAAFDLYREKLRKITRESRNGPSIQACA
jgi:hypothetical protein